MIFDVVFIPKEGPKMSTFCKSTFLLILLTVYSLDDLSPQHKTQQSSSPALIIRCHVALLALMGSIYCHGGIAGERLIRINRTGQGVICLCVLRVTGGPDPSVNREWGFERARWKIYPRAATRGQIVLMGEGLSPESGQDDK